MSPLIQAASLGEYGAGLHLNPLQSTVDTIRIVVATVEFGTRSLRPRRTPRRDIGCLSSRWLHLFFPLEIRLLSTHRQ
jgi:hypothetical protein